MSICRIEERDEGRSYPRTCPTCKLSGACAKGLDRESLKARIRELEVEKEAAEASRDEFRRMWRAACRDAEDAEAEREARDKQVREQALRAAAAKALSVDGFVLDAEGNVIGVKSASPQEISDAILALIEKDKTNE